jgi:myosin-crossreactive antigen
MAYQRQETESAELGIFNATSPARRIYLVGAGIASMAAAAFLIRDGDVRRVDVTIFEESVEIGGSLDGAGSPETGYILWGGRMLESKYSCTFDLFSSIPTLNESRTVHVSCSRPLRPCTISVIEHPAISIDGISEDNKVRAGGVTVPRRTR